MEWYFSVGRVIWSCVRESEGREDGRMMALKNPGINTERDPDGEEKANRLGFVYAERQIQASFV